MRLETAARHIWQRLDREAALVYLTALRSSVHLERAGNRWERWYPCIQEDVDGVNVGPYRLETTLGMGGNGRAFAAHDRQTGAPVTVKVNCGTEGVVFEWLGRQLPPQFLKVYAWDWEPYEVLKRIPDQPLMDCDWPCWVARERADETWAEYRERCSGQRWAPDLVLRVLATACSGVAALHAKRVYQWSAHERNVFRVGEQWKLGDLGRCCFSTAADDVRLRPVFMDEGLAGAERARVLEEYDRGPWKSFRSSGPFAVDPTREHRLRLDDCAMLGGLLCDLLGVNRWHIFSQALKEAQVCQGRYTLTGDDATDDRLSCVLNRAWLGDAGGALALTCGEDWTAGYSDALELLSDVEDVLQP